MPHTIPFVHTYQSLPSTFYQAVQADTPGNPKLIIFNQTLADELGLDTLNVGSDTLTTWFSGQSLPETASPIAQAYAGHQFGQLTTLGDGRAMLLGEIRSPQGTLVDMQFKGSGRTPYSRGGDGKAVLAPMLREYLISEAMSALRIPTTRSLAVVTTGDSVRRRGAKIGAILTRTAASHLRIGTFVYAAMLANHSEDNTALQALLDYSIDRHYPELATAENPALAFLYHVGLRQINVVNHWLRVGFIHGVMNTDNVCISGETIDYGPCAFMNGYDEKTVFSSIDRHGRYAFGNQSAIILWNLARLAEALLPLIADEEDTAIELATTTLERLQTEQQQTWSAMMSAKLGLQHADDPLVADLLTIMQTHGLDYSNTFVSLTQLLVAFADNAPDTTWFDSDTYQNADYAVPNINTATLTTWCQRWLKQLKQQNPTAEDWQTTLATMQAQNPVLIPRNHHVETALSQAEQGDMRAFTTLLTHLSKPYDWQSTTSEQSIGKFQRPPTTEQDNDYQTFCGT